MRKYFLLLCLYGCGGENNAPINPNDYLPAIPYDSRSVEIVMRDLLPEFRVLCVDNNLPLIEQQRIVCRINYLLSEQQCANYAAMNLVLLTNKWNEISAWVRASLDECTSDVRENAAHCFSVYERELSRRISECPGTARTY